MAAIKTGTDLTPGDILIGFKGGTSHIEDIQPATTMPGFLAVETEHGFLYLDPDDDYEIENA